MKNVLKTLKRYQGLTISAVMLTISLLTILFVVIPLGKRAVSLYTATGRIQEEVRQLTQKEALLTSLDEATLQEQRATVLSALPSEKAVPSLFAQMEQMAIVAGLGLTDIALSSVGPVASDVSAKLSPEEKAVGANIVPFLVSAEGNIDQVKNFFGLVSSVRRLLRIKNFSVTFNETASGLVRVDMEAFYAPLPKTIGTISERVTSLSEDDDALLAKLAAFQSVSVSEGRPLAPSVGIEKANPFAP